MNIEILTTVFLQFSTKLTKKWNYVSLFAKPVFLISVAKNSTINVFLCKKGAYC